MVYCHGNVDGGIQHGEDYSNTEWCLGGMNWAINAAKWLGKNDEATKWQRYYDTLYHNFIAKAAKDVRKDEFGNPYLPVMINNEQNQLPQRGQWAFCHSVYPGQIFDNDSMSHRIAKETVDMLASHKVEGLVLTTGWMENGLWTYFTSFYAHALQWIGEGDQVPNCYMILVITHPQQWFGVKNKNHKGKVMTKLVICRTIGQVLNL